MKLREINNLIIGKVPSLNPDDDAVRAKTTQYTNLALDGVWRAAGWEFRKRNAQLMLEPNYTTGTCSWTKLGRRVDFSGSVLDGGWRGRYWIPLNGTAQYKIIYVNVAGNYVLVDVPIIDATASGVTFNVWKRFYSLKSDCDSLLDIRRWDGGGSLQYLPDVKMSKLSGNIETIGSPYYFATQGIDEYDDIEYTAGDISGTENTDEITGSGTAFLGNCDTGDSVFVGTREYTIRRVESDTSLKLYQNIVSGIAAGTSYEIRKNNPLNVTFYNPPDAYRICDYSYLNKAPILKNEDYDYLKLSMDYIDAIILRAQAYWLDEKDYQKFQTIIALYQAKVNGLKEKNQTVRPRFMQFEPTISASLPGRE